MHELIISIGTTLVIILGALGTFYKVFVIDKGESDYNRDFKIAENQTELIIKPLKLIIAENVKKIEELEAKVKTLEKSSEENQVLLRGLLLSYNYFSTLIQFSESLNVNDDMVNYPPIPTELADIYSKFNII